MVVARGHTDNTNNVQKEEMNISLPLCVLFDGSTVFAQSTKKSKIRCCNKSAHASYPSHTLPSGRAEKTICNYVPNHPHHHLFINPSKERPTVAVTMKGVRVVNERRGHGEGTQIEHPLVVCVKRTIDWVKKQQRR